MKRLYIIQLIGLLLVLGCNGKPLFDQMADNKLIITVKGTFESTADCKSIKSWDKTVSYPQSIDDSVNQVTDSSEHFPSLFMMDIAEIRLVRIDGTVDNIATERQVFIAGVSDDDPFFNGQGIVIQADDIKPDTVYIMAFLYIRKMVFDNATQWYIDSSGMLQQGVPPTTIFHETNVFGYDFNQLMVNAYYDTLKQNYSEVNRVFPLAVPIDGGLVMRKNEPVVLEIRLLLKNFIKLYEYNFINTQNLKAVYHYWAPSDWLRDVKNGDIAIGGNLIAVAHSYKPLQVATVSGTVSGTAPSGYIIAIPVTDTFGSNQDINNYFMDTTTSNPLWARPIFQPYVPPVPLNSNNTVEGWLDYYLCFEQYKVEYNTFVTAVNNRSYENNWRSYDILKNSFRLPPLVAHSNGSYTLTNVPLGDYLFYFVDDGDVPYGTLPDVSNVKSSGKTTTINVGSNTVDFPLSI